MSHEEAIKAEEDLETIIMEEINEFSTDLFTDREQIVQLVWALSMTQLGYDSLNKAVSRQQKYYEEQFS